MLRVLQALVGFLALPPASLAIAVTHWLNGGFSRAVAASGVRPPADVVLHPRCVSRAVSEAVGDLVALAEKLYLEGWEVGIVIEEPIVRSAVSEVSCTHIDRSLPLAALARAWRPSLTAATSAPDLVLEA